MAIMVRAIVRPEKSADVMQALLEAGYPAVTKFDVFGRGRQRGLKVGNTLYDELPKVCLLVVIPETEKPFVIKTILKSARTGNEGTVGDGKIFVSEVDEVYTISTGVQEYARGKAPGRSLVQA
jgi:nitrogen regulatory protein PII 1